MHIAVGYEAPRIAGFDRTEPQRDVRRLRCQHIRNVRSLHVLVVKCRCVQYGETARIVRTIDIQGQTGPIAHGDPEIPLFDHVHTPTSAPNATRRWECDSTRGAGGLTNYAANGTQQADCLTSV